MSRAEKTLLLEPLILKNPDSDWDFRTERVGFEPTVPVKTRWFSRPKVKPVIAVILTSKAIAWHKNVA